MLNIEKLLYTIRQNWKRYSFTARKYLEGIGMSWQKFFVLLFLFFVTSALVADMYRSINTAIENYKLLEVERQKLAEEESLSQDLDEQLEYFSSLEYSQRYAYDSLNLAREDERIYSIDTSERVEYELEEINPDPILQEEKKLWWDLIFEEIKRNSF